MTTIGRSPSAAGPQYLPSNSKAPQSFNTRTHSSSSSSPSTSSTSSTAASPSMLSSSSHPHLSHTQPSSSILPSSSSSPSVSHRPRMPRTSSLRRVGPGALVIPVPPKLANSPHLQSPNSMFRRGHPAPRESPGVEEERWLRDTVPMGYAVEVVASPPPPPHPPSPRVVSMTGTTTGRMRASTSASASASARSPQTPVLPALLPSSLPRSGVFPHTHAQPLSPRQRS